MKKQLLTRWRLDKVRLVCHNVLDLYLPACLPAPARKPSVSIILLPPLSAFGSYPRHSAQPPVRKCLWAMTQISISSPGLWTLHHSINSCVSPHSWAAHSFNKDAVSWVNSWTMHSVKALFRGGFCLLWLQPSWCYCFVGVRGEMKALTWQWDLNQFDPKEVPEPNPKPTVVDQK